MSHRKCPYNHVLKANNNLKNKSKNYEPKTFDA